MAKETKKSQLGKGIRALISSMDDAEPQQKQRIVKDLAKTTNEIPIEYIEVNPYQPRVDFEKEALDELAQSIRVHGVIQPITVRRLSDEAYQIISGERRWRAARQAGLEQIPAYVRLADDQGMLEMALIENVQRRDLNAMEVAVSLERLMQECDLTHEALSERIAKKRSTVTNYLRLLKLPPEIQKALKSETISMGHARALAGIDDISLQLTVFKELITKELSVRKLEELIRSYRPGNQSVGKTTPSAQSSPELEQLERNLKGIFGSPVNIQRNQKGAGKIVIHFNSDKNLNFILDVLSDIEG